MLVEFCFPFKFVTALGFEVIQSYYNLPRQLIKRQPITACTLSKHLYQREDISQHHLKRIKMNKTAVLFCVLLMFISSLLVVEGMVAVSKATDPSGKVVVGIISAAEQFHFILFES